MSNQTGEHPDDASRSAETGDSIAPSRMDAGLFVVSATVLALEILQFKIFAFSLDPLTIYLAVGVCLLGLGASATVLALVPPVAVTKVRSTASFFTVAGAVLIPVSHLVFAHLAQGLNSSGVEPIVVLVALTLPYFCFGMTITLLLVGRGGAIGRAYASNLAGSGLGCLLVFPLLDHLGAERSLIVLAGLGIVSALVLAPPRRLAARGATVLISLALGATLMWAPRLFSFPPDPSGQLSRVLATVARLQRDRSPGTVTATPLLTRWDRTARVDVYDLDASDPKLTSRIGSPLEILFFVQDASAGSILLGVGDDLRRGREFFEGTLYGAAYALGAVDDTLVIGVGGAPDVLTALYHGVRRVVGVEINSTTINIIRKEFSGFVGHPYHRPEVTLHRMDGRTFLRGDTESYDLIQMSGADTKSAFASGSLSVNENYLYTREAMGELLRRLRPDGVLAIVRFTNIDVHRLASIAVAGLRDMGAESPALHLIAIAQGKWRSLLIKRTPFTAEEVERVHAWVEGREGAPEIVIPAYDWIGLGLGKPMRVIYSPEPRPVAETPYFRALREGRMAGFLSFARSVGVDLSAPVDDRPFFFFLTPPGEALRKPPPVLRMLFRLVVQLTSVAAVFILTPLMVLRWRGLRAARAGRTLVYFSCLGAAFMLVEIGLIHRFVLFLGHQSYAVTVVLFGLLVGASTGSVLSGRLGLSSRRPLAAALVALILLILGYGFGLGALFDAVSVPDFSLRLVLALVLLAPLGVLLGIPFPLGLRSLHAARLPLVAWSVGVNGFASVVGATIAVPIAMVAGLRVLLVLGALLYGVVLLTSPLAPRGNAS